MGTDSHLKTQPNAKTVIKWTYNGLSPFIPSDSLLNTEYWIHWNFDKEYNFNEGYTRVIFDRDIKVYIKSTVNHFCGYI